MGRSRWRPMRARQCINMLHRQPPITGRVKPILGVGAAHGAQQKKRRNNAAEGIYHEANYSRGEMPHCHRKATHMPPHLYFTCSLQGVMKDCHGMQAAARLPTRPMALAEKDDALRQSRRPGSRGSWGVC